MKKFIYLRKFNESSNQDLDFETFKEIMFEITDNFDAEVIDWSDNVEDEKFYECVVNTPFLKEYELPNINDISLPSHDWPEKIDLKGIYKEIEDREEVLERLKSIVDTILNNNSKVRDFFKIIEEYIIPRFETFENYSSCSIGYEESICELRIWFNIIDKGKFHY